MIIDVLVVHMDGTQTIEKQEVPDNWYDPPPEPAPEPDYIAYIAGLMNGGISL